MEISKPEPVNNQLGINQLWEVFSWLPAKEVIKTFSSVSKTAHSILSEPLFAEKQSIRSSRFDNGFFLQPDTCWNSRDWLEIHGLPLNGDPPSSNYFPNKSLSFLHQNGRVLSSSQGLVLLRETDRDNGLLICNPVTKKWAPLCVPEWLKPHKIRDCGVLLACHPRNLVTGTVIVPVLVEVDNGCWDACDKLAIYQDGKWEAEMIDLTIKGRELGLNEPLTVLREDGLVVHYLCKSLPNALRKPVYEEPYVVAYSMQKKALTRIFKLPEGAWEEEDDGHDKLKIFKWGSSNGETIGVVRVDGCMITTWVLEDYEGGVWRKVMEKSTIEMGVEEEEERVDVKGCCVVNSQVLVFATNRRVYMYEMEGLNVGNLEVVIEHDYSNNRRVAFTAYANTLRPVDTDGDASLVTF